MDRSSKTATPGIPTNFPQCMKQIQLIDVWRKENPDYMFLSKHHLTQSRIEYLLVTENIEIDWGSSGIGECTMSDHAPEFAEWIRGEQTLQSRFWKLNNYLLAFTGLEEQMRKEINSFLEINARTAARPIVQDIFKAYMRNFIAFRTFRDKQRGLAREMLLIQKIKLRRT